MIIKGSFLLFFLFFSLNAMSQPDSAKVVLPEIVKTMPTTELSKKEKRTTRIGNRKISPKKAVLLSLGLPGAGQIYNRRYWKLPFVYGALGTMGYFIAVNTKDLKTFRKAYLYRTDDDPDTIDEFEGIYSTSNIQSLRNSAQSTVELSYIGFFLAYALTSIDAFVDAHLHSFDLNDDLSLDIGPELMMTRYQNPALGVGLHLRNNARSKKTPASLF